MSRALKYLRPEISDFGVLALSLTYNLSDTQVATCDFGDFPVQTTFGHSGPLWTLTGTV